MGPSHILSGSVDLRATVSQPLVRDAFVTLKACAGEWTLIAGGGKDIGYVRYSILEPVN